MIVAGRCAAEDAEVARLALASAIGPQRKEQDVPDACAVIAAEDAEVARLALASAIGPQRKEQDVPDACAVIDGNGTR